MPKRPAVSTLAAAAALFAACLAVYGSALGGGFVWDDWQLIVENQALRGLDGARLAWMATSFYRSTYQPLGWLAYAFLHAAWGLNPFYLHAAGVALHAVCAVLLFGVARRLLARAGHERAPAAAFAAALLWAVHPLQAGTAAWATEIPDQLATAFVLGSILVYAGRDSARRLPLSLALFALSGLCRWKGVGLPLVLVALDVYPLRRLDRRAWVEKLAFALVAVLILFANSFAKVSSGFDPSPAAGTIARGLLLYPKLLAWPGELLPLYDLSDGVGFAAIVLLLLGAAGLLAARRRLPAAPAALACFAAGILPPLLNAKHGITLAFPHYAYLSTMGFFVAVAAALPARRAAAAAVLGLALFWGVQAHRLAPLWGDELSLWTRAATLDEDNVLFQGNLGNALARAGRHDEAYIHFARAKDLSRGRYRWNQEVQHRNIQLLKRRAPGVEERARELSTDR